jgi:antirestriction protein ArdC
MTKEKRKDVYEVITERVIEGLKNKGLAWFKPWVDEYGNIIHPINYKSGRAYRGINVSLLSFTADMLGYEHNEWLTWKNANDMGNPIRKGEKSTQVVNWIISYFDKETKKWYSASEVKKLDQEIIDRLYKSFSVRTFNVFNIAQCEKDVKPKRKPLPAPKEGKTFTPIKRAELVYKGYDGKPTLKHGGAEAYYLRSRHHVQMPKQESFIKKTSADDYYKTLFHELVHSTGHESLLKRKTLTESNGFGSKIYSQEELVAEIGSNYLVAITGIEPKDNEKNSQAYINGWVKHLSDHPKEIVYAATQAQKAVDKILGDK